MNALDSRGRKRLSSIFALDNALHFGRFLAECESGRHRILVAHYSDNLLLLVLPLRRSSLYLRRAHHDVHVHRLIKRI